MRKIFEGNTLSGRFPDLRPFSEFHHPDGRVFGHNSGVPNTDACWTTVEDGICYYYGPLQARRTLCYTFEVMNMLYIGKAQPGGRLTAIGKIEPGNPHNHGDNGTSWYCDGNISQRPHPLRRHYTALSRPRPAGMP